LLFHQLPDNIAVVIRKLMVSRDRREGAMTTIDAKSDVVTLINVFTVAPERQQRLLDVLAEATVEVIAGMPGFVSANLHRSFDGTRVANYAQWRSREELEAMLAHPSAAAHLREAAALATAIEPHLYAIAFVASPRDAAARPAGSSAS